MDPSGKRNSVTYDARRIRVPPEASKLHAEKPPSTQNKPPYMHSSSSPQLHLPQLHSPSARVVSDDVVQRKLHLDHSSPDSFDFRDPIRSSRSQDSRSSETSGTFHNSPISRLSQNSPRGPEKRDAWGEVSHGDGQFSGPPHGSPFPANEYSSSPLASNKDIDAILVADHLMQGGGLSRSSSKRRSCRKQPRRYSSYPEKGTPKHDQNETFAAGPSPLAMEAASGLSRETLSTLDRDDFDPDIFPNREAAPIDVPAGSAKAPNPATHTSTAFPPQGDSFSFSEADDAGFRVSPARTQFSAPGISPSIAENNPNLAMAGDPQKAESRDVSANSGTSANFSSPGDPDNSPVSVRSAATVKEAGVSHRSAHPGLLSHNSTPNLMQTGPSPLSIAPPSASGGTPGKADSLVSFSPPKSIKSTVSSGSNVINSIISNYDHSSSSLMLVESSKSVDARSYPLTNTPALQNPIIDKNPSPSSEPQNVAGYRSVPPSHDRHDSQSSNFSSTSSSTVTSSHNQNQQQRFMRYVMSNQAKSAATAYPGRWAIESVFTWLEHHKFPDAWKETFRRNEISGNRFLELGNYDSSSAVWQQLSKTLGSDADSATVERFIGLISAETLDIDSFNTSPSMLELEPYSKLENRKSSSTLWAQNTPTVATKQRPFSYIDPGNNKPTKEHSKFFRKHNRLLSGESAKEKEREKEREREREKDKEKEKEKEPGSAHSAKSAATKSSGEASSGSNNLGFKKSGILSTLRKYGGEKAAGIVKQVHSAPSSAKASAGKRISSSFPKQKKSERFEKSDFASKPQPPPENSRHESFGSQGSVYSSHTSHKSFDEHAKSPGSGRSLGALHSSSNSIPASLKYSGSHDSPNSLPHPMQRLGVEEIFEQEFLPVPNKKPETFKFTILLTRDNNSFVPFHMETQFLDDLGSLKAMFLRKLDMLDIGTISFHLTEFDSLCGAPLPDYLLHTALQQGLVSKLKLEQTFRSPDRLGTMSSASSDSKSFETSGDNGKMYPATPQYLLQHSSDKTMDYMNFKDSVRSRGPGKDPDLPPLPSFGSSERILGPYPMNLSLPQSKRMLQHKSSAGNIGRRGLPLINTSASSQSPEVPSETDSKDSKSKTDAGQNPSPNSTFTVVRREGREIDFNQRRLNPTESKVPRLIPNIYSSSMTDSTVSPISASTVHTFKDDIPKTGLPTISTNSPSSTTPSAAPSTKRVSARSRAQSAASDFEKGGSFVARRKAPPPPTASNSLRVKKKDSSASLGISVASNYSENNHQSNDSIDSIRSSQAGMQSQNVRKFDFSDAPALDLPDEEEEDGSDSDDDGFFKPLKVKPETALDQNQVTKSDAKDEKVPGQMQRPGLSHDSDMTMRPSVDEVYDNLEKYFPNTILDKPIIDAYPESPAVPSLPASISNSASRKSKDRRPTISRTFSNANMSPVHPEKGADDEVLYVDGPKLRRRMKTIRAVAHEAYSKRLASLRMMKEPSGGKSTKKQSIRASAHSLTRTNTKLWGQKVVEVTSDEIEKGLVSRIRKIADNEEFAWVKGELIGRGSFGSVYLALNVNTGEMLAVKQVNVSEAKSSSDGVDAFYKEVETMKDLDHLNIVQYLGFEKSKFAYSLFLEYVAGGSVSSCLKSYGKFDEPVVKFITRQVLEGLKYLHENGILHRDLKADNLLLETDGVCKISDFGISKKSQDIYSNNAEMSMQGTVFWMAPEVIDSIVEEKKQGYSAKVDIWSLGCVMLEMFAGQRPWSNEAVVSAIYKLGKTKLAPPIPEDVSQEAKDFLNKCFTIDSEKRPTAAELLGHQFMVVETGFQFNKTKLSETIKSNSTRNMVKKKAMDILSK